MALTHGLGTYGNGVGTVTPEDHKLALAGLIAKRSGNLIRPGVFWGGVADLVVGKGNMSYDVLPFTAALTRGASSGAVLLSNDGTVNVPTTAAPGSNSRIDVIYVWQREFALDGGDSEPVLGVAQGTPAAVPSVPSLAAFPGAIALAQVRVPAGTVATNSGTTFTQVAPFTATAGGMIPFRTKAEADLSVLPKGTRSVLLADLSEWVSDGTAWIEDIVATGLMPIIPTSVSGGSISGSGLVTFSSITELLVNGCFTSAYRKYRVEMLVQTHSAAVPRLRLRGGGTTNTAAQYDKQRLIVSGSSVAAAQHLAQTIWDMGVASFAGKNVITLELADVAQATATVGKARNHASPNPMTSEAGSQEATIQHRANTAFDGLSILPNVGNISGWLRVYGYA